jgi:hypothetical protein
VIGCINKSSSYLPTHCACVDHRNVVILLIQYVHIHTMSCMYLLARTALDSGRLRTRCWGDYSDRRKEIIGGQRKQRSEEPPYVSYTLYRYIQITWYLSSLTLDTDVISKVRPLLGWRQNGEATLYLFPKHILCQEHEYIVSRNKTASVKVTFCVFVYNLFLLKILYPPLRSSA